MSRTMAEVRACMWAHAFAVIGWEVGVGRKVDTAVEVEACAWVVIGWKVGIGGGVGITVEVKACMQVAIS